MLSFNKKYYDSNDMICTISKVTDDIVRTVSPEVECVRIQHTVDHKIFCKKSEEVISKVRQSILETEKLYLTTQFPSLNSLKLLLIKCIN